MRMMLPVPQGAAFVEVISAFLFDLKRAEAIGSTADREDDEI